MSTHPSAPRSSWVEPRLPLPGNFECITWQLNATVYPPSKMARVVSILRDPGDQIELSRSGMAILPYPALLEWLRSNLGETLAQIEAHTGVHEPF